MDHYILTCLLLVAAGTGVRGSWFDSEDMQLFDLVEEVNGTFYDFMNLNQSATASDVKKAFRLLSLKLHPDKSSDPDAEIKFRHLVSISEVLKDDAKREKYNNILQHGLPDWKTGMYYVRRARKLGLAEMSIVVSLILTIGHYLCLIAAYHEKVFEAREMIKKKEKKLSKTEYADLLQEVMEANNIRRPVLSQDNLPLKTIKFCYKLAFVSIPLAAAHFVQLVTERLTPAEPESEEQVIIPRVKKVRAQESLPDFTGEADDDDGRQENQQQSENTTTSNTLSSFHCDEWTQQEMLLLIKTCKKFPVGTSQRWERVAEVIGRSVDDVTRMSKSIRSGQVKVAEPVISANSSNVVVSDSDITSRDIDPSDSIQNWSQSEQKLLEEGLSKYPKGVDGRWDRISEYTGKSKEDCINRFKWLAELVKKKKTLVS